MDLEQTVRAAFALREPAADFEDVVMARLAAGKWRASQPAPRRRRAIVLLGALLAIAAAASMLVASLTSGWPAAVSRVASVAAAASSGAPALAGPAASAPAQIPLPDGSSPKPVTVSLSLEQVTVDALGRDYGQRVYDRAREELRALPGVVLVDAATAAPDFRIAFINLAESFGTSPLRIKVEMVFQVEAARAGADGERTYQPVFRSNPPPPGVVIMPPSLKGEMIPSLDQEPIVLVSSARMTVRPALAPAVLADCVERRGADCPYTPADIAAFSILSWRLQQTAPDARLVERLHTMLRNPSSPAGLRLMALVNLHKYGKLHLDAAETLAAAEWIGADDRALFHALLQDALGMGSKPELMRQVQASLLGAGMFNDALTTGSRADLPRSVQDVLQRNGANGSRSASTDFHRDLVVLLATELKDEAATPGILEWVAANDPDFYVRAEAKRALGQPEPAASFMGPVDEP